MAKMSDRVRKPATPKEAPLPAGTTANHIPPSSLVDRVRDVFQQIDNGTPAVEARKQKVRDSIDQQTTTPKAKPLKGAEEKAMPPAIDLEIVMVPIDEIWPNPDNAREGRFDEAEMDELVESIRSVGLLNPLTVKPKRQKGDQHDLIAGHRRLEACKRAGYQVVPCIVRDLAGAGALEAALVENLQRSDISALDEARAYKRLIDEAGLDQATVSVRVGRSQAHVSKRLSLLELPPTVAVEVGKGSLTLDAAQTLARLPAKKAAEILERARTPRWEGDGTSFSDRAISKAETHLQEQKATKDRAALRKKLKAEGVTVVDRQVLYEGNRKNKAEIGRGWGKLEVDAKAHASEPCHAAVVGSFSAKIESVVCLEVSRHAAKGQSALKGKVVSGVPTQTQRKKTPEQLEVDRQAEEREQLYRAEAARRVSRVQALMKRKVQRDDIVELVLGAVAGATHAWENEIRLGDGAVSLEVLGEKKPANYQAAAKALETYGAESADAAARVLLARLVADIEETLEDLIGYQPGESNAGAWEEHRFYLDWLGSRCGHEPGELEKEAVNPKPKAPAKKTATKKATRKA